MRVRFHFLPILAVTFIIAELPIRAGYPVIMRQAAKMGDGVSEACVMDLGSTTILPGLIEAQTPMIASETAPMAIPTKTVPMNAIPAEYRLTEAKSYIAGKVLESVRANTTGFSRKAPDFSFMDGAIGKAQVIGIGQQTHGSREVFKAQADLFMDLVSRHGVRLLLLEDGFDAVAIADDYIHGKAVDIKAMTQGLQTPWRVREMGNLLGAMRKWNGEHPKDQVDIIGIDYQTSSVTRAIDAAMVSVPSGRLKQWGGFQKSMSRFMTGMWPREWAAFNLDDMTAARADADRFLRMIELNSTVMGPQERLKALLGARAVLGGLDARIAILKASKARVGKDVPVPMVYRLSARDTFMAADVMIFMDLFPKAKCAVWAHSLHTGKESSTGWQPMGSMVVTEKGEDSWCNVGIGTRCGTVLAVDSREWSKIGSQNPAAGFYKTYEYPEPIVGTLEGMIHQAKEGDAVCDLKKSRPEGWLDMPCNTYMLGATINPDDPFEDRYFECRPSKFFDFYILLDKTSSTKILHSF